ncbi:hypothetical protein [Zhongshania sp.]|jgi:hypothetical protein|uniref:hypothetical protein n=1 Tax=Zhongshania sp. TaxID=1971902 RepID=UPI0039E3A2A7
MAKWSALRTWWVRDNELGLKAFTGGHQAGTSLASLKVLMALSLLADFHLRTARNSVSDLEKITGLSRPMVLAGITDLESKGIISVGRSSYVNEYLLKESASDVKWAKLPYERLRKRLPDISNRGAVVLAALKIYILLASYRPNASVSLSFSHQKIRDLTGIQTKHVRPALDVLLNHTLIRLTVDDSNVSSENYKGKHNVYTLLGLTAS